MPPPIERLVTGYMSARATGQMPWEIGIRVGRRRFWQASQILSNAFEMKEIMRPASAGCPLLERGDV